MRSTETPRSTARSGIDEFLNVEVIKKKLAAVERKLGPLLAEREKLQAFMRLYEKFGGAGESGEAAGPRAPQQPDHGTRSARSGALAAASPVGGPALAKLAIEEVRAAGRPLGTAEVLRLLRAKGVEPTGKRPDATLYASLYREAEIGGGVRNAGGRWMTDEMAHAAQAPPLGSRGGNVESDDDNPTEDGDADGAATE